MRIAAATINTHDAKRDDHLRSADFLLNVALETGGWLLSDTININIDLEIVQQPEAVAEAGA